MKNKSKLRKVKQKNAGLGQAFVPKEWLYLNPGKITVREVAEVFSNTVDLEASSVRIRAQLWEDAGVVEIELPEAKSMDLELAEADLGDEIGNAFLEQHQVQTVFLVTVVPEDYEKAKPAMEQIVKALGGFFCGDTEDFTPVVK